MNTAPTNADGLWQKDEIDILRQLRRAMGNGYGTDADTKKALFKHLKDLLADEQRKPSPTLLIEVGKMLDRLEQTDLKRLEVLDKISRLDSGQATERSEGVVINYVVSGDDSNAASLDPNHPPAPTGVHHGD